MSTRPPAVAPLCLLQPCSYIKNGDLVTLVRREQHAGAEWSWVRSERGAEGYVLGARLRCRPAPDRTDDVWVEPAA